MPAQTDVVYMQQALTLAAQGSGLTSPNPMVGAVVVRGSRVVGQGYHGERGTAHAEAIAIQRAGKHARGATLYVSLEPCGHTGKTGPCTDIILHSGIKRVVFAVTDPDTRVNGRGAALLRKAGVAVSSGTLRQQAELLNEAYVHSQKKQRPFVVAKIATSLDGQIATSSGDSRWISSQQSRKSAHRLRAECDAILIGEGTFRQDNPSLTVRHVRGRNPRRILLISNGTHLSTRANLLHATDEKTIIACPASVHLRLRKRLTSPHLTFWPLATAKNGLPDLHALLDTAHTEGMRSLLLEGGATLLTAFLREQLIDKYVQFISPKLLGRGVSVTGDLGIGSVNHAIQLERAVFSASGTDTMLVGYPQWGRAHV